MMVSQRLIEDDSTECYSWNKSTVEFVVKHKKDIMDNIRRLTYNNGVISVADVDDIYSELIMSLYNGKDYDILASDKMVISLAGFVNLCTKYSIKRYYYNKSRESARRFNGVNCSEDFNIIDNLKDDNIMCLFEDVDNSLNISLENALDNIEYKRNTYEYDILLLVFLRIIMGNMEETQYTTVLKLIGVDKRKLANMEREVARDEDLMTLFRMVAQRSKDEVIEALSKRVHGAGSLLKAVGIGIQE